MVNPFFIQDVTMLTQYLSLWRKAHRTLMRKRTSQMTYLQFILNETATHKIQSAD